jgi:LPXTG-site transpeptidase (sortase) family protein
MRLIIPELNVIADFQYNGLTPDGTMEIPTNIVDAGWYTGSPRPGEKGVAIITGHVAQIRKSVVTKPGVFYNLNELRPGDKLYVLNDKGETITFVVRESRLYDPTADATDVFTSNDNGAHLNIITCEGTWNQDQLSYSQRLVIFADAVQ